MRRIYYNPLVTEFTEIASLYARILVLSFYQKKEKSASLSSLEEKVYLYLIKI